MSKTRIALVGVAIGLVTLFSGAAAHAYPDPVITSPGGSAADGQVGPGETFTLTGTFGGTDCLTWTSSFTGQPGVDGGSGSGTSFSVTYTAPTEDGAHSVQITCDYDDGVAAPDPQPTSTIAPVLYRPASLAALPRTMTVSFPIIVGNPGSGTGSGGTSGGTNAAAPTDTSDDGILPSTGGPTVLLLVAGGALVVAGAGITVARRRNA